MQQCSNSIGALAAALAKAQAELTNPEKSQSAVIAGDRAGQGARSFRYAPLSSGLDIVRKTLGKHELAVVQATDIDQSTRTVRLKTTLAHSSGEWIASEWPVCSLGDVTAPQRMGTALTYARRYALFSLVGIAGEDDLDAPDLALGCVSEKIVAPGVGAEQAPAADRVPVIARRSSGTMRPIRTVLDPANSADLRDRLIGECGALKSEEEASTWAQKTLRCKNTLCSSDAEAVESCFRTKMLSFADDKHSGDAPTLAATAPAAGPGEVTKIRTAESDEIEASNAVAPPGPRRRDKAHLKFVAGLPCLVCGRRPADPHHLRFAQPRALGRKVSDEFVVPLCRSHHRQLHRSGRETQWWAELKLEPLKSARDLWMKTRHKRTMNGANHAMKI